MMLIVEPMREYIIQSVQVPEFTVEDDKIQYLDSRIRKRFTSQASSLSVVFKWDFGDGHTLNTSQRATTHEYNHPGIYLVRHQACLLDAPCCYNNNIPWCLKSISVVPPTVELGIAPILGFGLLLGLLMRKKCDSHKNDRDCRKHDCLWMEKEKKCIKKPKKAPTTMTKPPITERKH